MKTIGYCCSAFAAVYFLHEEAGSVQITPYYAEDKNLIRIWSCIMYEIYGGTRSVILLCVLFYFVKCDFLDFFFIFLMLFLCNDWVLFDIRRFRSIIYTGMKINYCLVLTVLLAPIVLYRVAAESKVVGLRIFCAYWWFCFWISLIVWIIWLIYLFSCF